MTSDQPQRRRGSYPGQKKVSTRGLWVDTRNGTLYNASLRGVVATLGFSESDYHRLWRALRKRGCWPQDLPIRPATTLDKASAQRTVVYEAELVLPLVNARTIEETVLKAGGWLRRIRQEKLPAKTRINRYRCVWLISGLVDYSWLEKLVAVVYGRFQEVNPGKVEVICRVAKVCENMPSNKDGNLVEEV